MPNTQRSPAAERALAIYRAALDAVHADRLTLAALQRDVDTLRVGGLALPLRAYEHIYVVGAGKAAAGMTQAVEERLGNYLTEGVVVTKRGHGGLTRRVRLLEAGHPVPDADSVRAGQAIYDLVRRAGERDLVLCLISGGASALMELPQEGITLDNLRAVTDLLLRAGATIDELNAVRACLSQLKAGGLARAAYPAQVVCLALSDVLGNPLHVIGSGPCVDTPVNPSAALAVLDRHAVRNRTPLAVLARLEQREGEGESIESTVDSRASRVDPERLTPNAQHLTPDAQRLTPNTQHLLLGDIWTALYAARDAALQLSLRPHILTGSLQGEAREVAKVFGGIARDLPRTYAETGIDCYIAGGETTVTVRGKGRGGRSQEIACAAAPLLAGVEGVALLAAGTDGTDGPTDAAGGLVDGTTLEKARARGKTVEAALRDNDAYPFLQAADALLITGPTHSNVGDLIVVVYQAG